MWASSVTLTQIAKVILEGDAHITVTLPPYKRQGNWLELTFAKTSGAVTGDSPFTHLPYA